MIFAMFIKKLLELQTTKAILTVIALTAASAILVPTYAVPQITSADIVNGQVKTEDLAPNAVTSPKIQDGQVKTADLADKAVSLAKLGSDVPKRLGVETV